MLFEFIATIVAGFAGAGVALLLNNLIGGRLPRWSVPIAAGGAMLASTIANEYGWYSRTVETLPDGLEVAMTVEDRAFYRPWGRVFPFVSRFMAVDTATMRRNDNVPEQRIVDVYLFGRWTAPAQRTVALDCASLRRADFDESVTVEQDGRLTGAAWLEVGSDDPILSVACDG